MPSLLFPGQGSQTVGMATGFMAHSATRDLFELADDTLGMGLSRLMREGPEDELRQTANAQPALLLAGYVAAIYLMHHLNKPLEHIAPYVVGHSLGEYTAVTIAGGMDLPTALKLVRLRGETMAKAVPLGAGGMTAVMGLDADVLQNIAKESGVFIANDNGGGQVILSGPLDGLSRAEDAAKAAGARKTIRLNVAGPFHTPAMQPAADAVKDFLQSHPLHPLTVPVVMNATAQPAHTPDNVAANLVRQITSPVRWRESMIVLAEAGVTACLELGVGKVLTGLAPRCDPRLSAISLDSPEAIEQWGSHL